MSYFILQNSRKHLFDSTVQLNMLDLIWIFVVKRRLWLKLVNFLQRLNLFILTHINTISDLLTTSCALIQQQLQSSMPAMQLYTVCNLYKIVQNLRDVMWKCLVQRWQSHWLFKHSLHQKGQVGCSLAKPKHSIQLLLLCEHTLIYSSKKTNHWWGQRRVHTSSVREFSK